jgi:hypothetical protein
MGTWCPVLELAGSASCLAGACIPATQEKSPGSSSEHWGSPAKAGQEGRLGWSCRERVRRPSTSGGEGSAFFPDPCLGFRRGHNAYNGERVVGRHGLAALSLPPSSSVEGEEDRRGIKRAGASWNSRASKFQGPSSPAVLGFQTAN